MSYTIKSAKIKPVLNSDWDGESWKSIVPLRIGIVRPESSEHNPDTQLKLQYTEDALYGLFKVEDQYVRSTNTEYQSNVCQDSCVEAFIRPKADKGYFNFEFNCGGTLLCSYIEDSTRSENGFKKYKMLEVSELEQVCIYHSMPTVVEPEITEPTQWFLGFKIPFSLLEIYIGNMKPLAKQQWKANFYKCADKTSHPHWISWNPISAKNFHLPDCFGSILLD